MENLFLIERDRDFADCLRKIFESEGFNVICVDSASAAIDRFAEISPMLAVIDLNDGEKVTLDDVDALTNHPSEIPVLVTAHYGNPEIACKALSIGADDYILKPFGTQEILEHIRRLAHGDGNGKGSETIEGITGSISLIGNPEDIFRTSLNQLSEILCLGDCLIAIRDGDSFRIVASRNYKPDPVGRLIKLSSSTTESLEAEGRNDNYTDTTGVREIVNALGLMSHRPFPILMPLSGEGSEILGFILGHGAIVLEENAILEMERFLSIVGREAASALKRDRKVITGTQYGNHGEVAIPEESQVEAIRKVLSELRPYLKFESDLIWLRLVLDEAINNSIIHGHGESLGKPEKPVLIRYSAGPSKLIISIEDTGEGFDPASIPDPTADENLMNINGRGIFLMKCIMDEVVFNDRGNVISLVKNVSDKPIRPLRNPGEEGFPFQ